MKLIIDDAHIDAIKRLYDYYPIDGVTTNPSILAKCERAPYEVLKEIREFIGQDSELHVQVVAKDYQGMIKDAHRILDELGNNTYIKIPAVPEGFKAMKQLVKEGVNITATAIYTPLQAYLAAKCGAKYVAPYINRIDDLGYNGVEIALEINNILKKYNYNTEVLAASFKNSMQVLELCRNGIGAATIAPSVIDNFLKNKTIESAIEQFTEDFENLTSEGSTMSNL